MYINFLLEIMSYILYRHVNIIKYQDKQTNEMLLWAVKVNFNPLIEWKFPRPQHAEPFSSHTAAHIQKNFQQGRAYPILWYIVLMTVSLRLKFAIGYAVGKPILTQVAFITTWLSKWVVLRGAILSKKSSRKTMWLLLTFLLLMTNTITLSDMSLKKTRSM